MWSWSGPKSCTPAVSSGGCLGTGAGEGSGRCAPPCASTVGHLGRQPAASNPCRRCRLVSAAAGHAEACEVPGCAQGVYACCPQCLVRLCNLHLESDCFTPRPAPRMGSSSSSAISIQQTKCLAEASEKGCALRRCLGEGALHPCAMMKQPGVRLASSYCPPSGVRDNIGGISVSWQVSANQRSPQSPMPSLLSPGRPEFINK